MEIVEDQFAELLEAAVSSGSTESPVRLRSAPEAAASAISSMASGRSRLDRRAGLSHQPATEAVQMPSTPTVAR
jgi:hypothetical protein